MSLLARYRPSNPLAKHSIPARGRFTWLWRDDEEDDVKLRLPNRERTVILTFPLCVNTSGGHRWNPPEEQGLQVCRSCGIVRPVDTGTNHQPYEVFDFDKFQKP